MASLLHKYKNSLGASSVKRKTPECNQLLFRFLILTEMKTRQSINLRRGSVCIPIKALGVTKSKIQRNRSVVQLLDSQPDDIKEMRFKDALKWVMIFCKI